jgi:transcriptional regulator with XRE-family HTH domain
VDDLDKLMSGLPEDERQAIEDRADALVMAHNLRELRVLAGQTQEQVSAKSGIRQTNVSRLEKRADMKLSTLREYVESLGGTLKIVADVAGKKVDLSRIVERSRPNS